MIPRSYADEPERQYGLDDIFDAMEDMNVDLPFNPDVIPVQSSTSHLGSIYFNRGGEDEAIEVEKQLKDREEMKKLDVGIYTVGPYNFMSTLTGKGEILASTFIVRRTLFPISDPAELFNTLKDKRKYKSFIFNIKDFKEEDINSIKAAAMYHKDMKTYESLRFNLHYVPLLTWFICPLDNELKEILTKVSRWSEFDEYEDQHFSADVFVKRDYSLPSKIWKNFKKVLPKTQYLFNPEIVYNLLSECLRLIGGDIIYFKGLMSVIGSKNVDTLISAKRIDYIDDNFVFVADVSLAHRADLLTKYNIRRDYFITHKIKDGEVMDYFLEDIDLGDTLGPYPITRSFANMREEKESGIAVIPIDKDIIVEDEDGIKNLLHSISENEVLDAYYRKKGTIKINKIEYHYIVRTSQLQLLKYKLMSF